MKQRIEEILAEYGIEPAEKLVDELLYLAEFEVEQHKRLTKKMIKEILYGDNS